MSFAVERSVSKQRIKDSRLSDYVNLKRKEGFFNDVTIKAGNAIFPANRMVLSCYSKYFENMFQTQMKERYENSAEIQSVDEKSLEMIIEYFYTGNIVIDNENVTQLLLAGDYLLVDEVKEYCFQFLESIITPDNCIDILNAANLYEKDSLKARVYEVIEQKLSDVVQSTKFKALSKPELISCLSSLDRNKIQETSFYEAIIEWTKHDEESRKKEFFDLFQLLNLDQISDVYLTNVVSEEEMVQDNLRCLKKVTKCLAQNVQNKSTKKSGSKIISIGGVNTLSEVTDIYDVSEKLKKVYPQLPDEVCHHSSLNLDNVVYCIGGEADILATDKVWKMDLSLDELFWENVASLNEIRSVVMGAAIYKDTIVVAGGWNGYTGWSSGTTLSSCEGYLKAFDEWKKFAPLQEARYGNALVSCDDCLFAIGGYDSQRYLSDEKFMSSVEQLYGLNGKWEFVESMQTPRRFLAAVNCKGFIYAIGGESDDNNSLKTVEKYDPAEEKWVYVKDMKIERRKHAACVLQDKIYVVGGLDGDGQVVKAIECYNPSCDEWSIVGETDNGLFGHSLVVV